MTSPICVKCNRFYIFNKTDTLCRKCKKDIKLLEDRKEKLKELKKGMINLIYANVSFTFETLIEESQILISKTQLKLTNEEIKDFVTQFYNKEKPTEDRLRQADHFYRELDHANSMIIETDENTVGLTYQ